MTVSTNVADVVYVLNYLAQTMGNAEERAAVGRLQVRAGGGCLGGCLPMTHPLCVGPGVRPPPVHATQVPAHCGQAVRGGAAPNGQVHGPGCLVDPH